MVAVTLLTSPPATAPAETAAGTLFTGSSVASPDRRPPVTVVTDGRTVTMVGLVGPRADGLVTRLAAEIPSAVVAVTSFWGSDWTREIVVLATGSDAQMADELGTVADGQQRADIAAVAVADHLDVAQRTAIGQRIVFAPGAFAMSDEALRIVLRHEFFHYAARVDTAADAPRWLTEGVADYVARPDAPRPGLQASEAMAAGLPTDADLDVPGSAGSAAYDRAWWFARFVADTYGPVTLRTVYLRACGAGHPAAAIALRDVLGADEPEVLAQWRRWLAVP